MRRSVVPVVAVMLACALTACGGSGNGKKKKGSRDGRPAAVAPADRDEDAGPVQVDPSPSITKAPRRKIRALTCADLRNAQLGTRSVPYHDDHPGPLSLRDGRWTGDGATVRVDRACATGDLDGDDAVDAVSAVVLDSGGTGRFWSLVVWRNVDGKPRYVTTTHLGDRTPVQSIRIAGQRATVVYLTHSRQAPAAAPDIRRTAVHRLTGSRFPEVSHTDTAPIS